MINLILTSNRWKHTKGGILFNYYFQVFSSPVLCWLWLNQRPLLCRVLAALRLGTQRWWFTRPPSSTNNLWRRWSCQPNLLSQPLAQLTESYQHPKDALTINFQSAKNTPAKASAMGSKQQRLCRTKLNFSVVGDTGNLRKNGWKSKKNAEKKIK